MPRIFARRRAMPAALVAAAAALLCLIPGTARAGTYDVSSCNADGTSAGWASYGSGPYAEGMVCPYSGDLEHRGFGVANFPNAGVTGASGAGLMFKAPVGTSLVGIGAGIRIQRWDAGYWLGLFSASGQSLYGFWANDGNGAPAGSYLAHGWFNLGRESNVHLEVGCASLCDTAAIPGPNVRAWAQMYDPITIRIEDDDAPAETLTGGGLVSTPYAAGTQTVSYSASDASGIRATRLYVDGVKLRDDSRSCNFEQPVPCSNINGGSYSLDTGSLADGQHTVKVESVDAAGNAASQSRSITVDNTAPTAPSVGVAGGEGWRSSNSFGLTWATPSGQAAPIASAHYQVCKADQPASCLPAGVQAAPGINSLSGLSVPAEGDYTVTVWLEDAAGNTSAASSSAPVHLRYDATAPEQPKDLALAGGEGWHASNSFDLSWTEPAAEIAPIGSARYRLCDSQGACSTEERDGPLGMHSLSDLHLPAAGAYTLTLWLVDEAGNAAEANASPALHLKLDDIDPGRAEPAQAAGWLGAADVEDGYDEQVSLAAGEAPGPSGLAGFAVSTDGSDPGRSPDIGPDGRLHIPEIPEGRLTVNARAVSNSGVASSRVGSAVLSVDKTAPSASASGAPDPDAWQPHAVSVTLRGEDQPELSGMAAGHLTYSVDGEPAHTVDGASASVAVTDDGSHTLRYSATDAAGNTSAEESLSLKIDASAPGDAVLRDPGRWLNADDAADYVQEVSLAEGASVPLSGLAGFSFTTDGESPDATPDTAGRSFNAGRLAEGTTVFKARAVSGSGLASERVAEVHVHVDRTAPEVSVVDPPDADAWQRGTVRVELKATDALSGMTGGSLVYSLDEGDEQTLPGATATVEVGSDGSHSIRYAAVDAAGNRSGFGTASFRIDSGKPGVAAPESSRGWVNPAGPYLEQIHLGDAEAITPSGLAGFSVTTDGSMPDDTPETDATGNFSIEELPEGVTTIKARAVSGTGVASDAVGAGTIKVDRTPPVTTLRRPADGLLVAEVSDALSGVESGVLELRATGSGSWRSLDTRLHDGRLEALLDLGRLEPGSYELRATAVDAAGNRRVVTSFAAGDPASVTVAPVQPAQPAALPQAPSPQAATKVAPHVRCSAKTKRAKRVHSHRHAGRHHRRAHQRHRHAGRHRHRRLAHRRHLKHSCTPGGEKHRHRHLGGKTHHKRARRTAG